tara:strand:- start:15 stop:644 length:630 start_codon:yes stop_codon:yes gene_type:complete
MILKENFWFFKKAVPDRICEDLIKHGLSQQPQMAITGSQKGNVPTTKKGFKRLHKTRNSDIVWLNERWIYKEVQPYIHQANKNANWNFEWDFTEPAQFTIYKKDQHYTWHTDSWEVPYNEPTDLHRHGKIRKLSVTLTLSDEKDYKGGELEFNLGKNIPGNKKNTVIPKGLRDKGTLIIFPSHIPHRIRPVTEGTRYSLVMWALGYPFK